MVVVRKITDTGLDLIKRFEGLYLSPYICPAGFPTIGYGHEIKPGEKFDKITEEEALDLLSKDLLIAQRSVCRLIKIPLLDWQYDALVSFTFNLGGGRLQASTLRRKVNQEEFYNAANEFPRWVYANGKKLAGLVRRRGAEKELFLNI